MEVSGWFGWTNYMQEFVYPYFAPPLLSMRIVLTRAIMELPFQHSSLASQQLDELSHCHTGGETVGVHDLRGKGKQNQ